MELDYNYLWFRRRAGSDNGVPPIYLLSAHHRVAPFSSKHASSVLAAFYRQPTYLREDKPLVCPTLGDVIVSVPSLATGVLIAYEVLSYRGGDKLVGSSELPPFLREQFGNTQTAEIISFLPETIRMVEFAAVSDDTHADYSAWIAFLLSAHEQGHHDLILRTNAWGIYLVGQRIFTDAIRFAVGRSARSRAKKDHLRYMEMWSPLVSVTTTLLELAPV